MRVKPHRTAALLLALVLVAAQGLGLAHRVAHPGSVSRGTAEAASVAAWGARASQSVGAHAPPPLAAVAETADRHALFDGHDPGGTECRLLDQAAQSDALIDSAPPATPPRAAAPCSAQITSTGAGRTAFAYLARGPPRPARLATPA